MVNKPNILFLFPDQHRGDYIPFSSSLRKELGLQDVDVRMPNLKKIMNCGTTFTNCVTPSPLCAPARSCLSLGTNYTDCEVPDNGTNMPLNRTSFYKAQKLFNKIHLDEEHERGPFMNHLYNKGEAEMHIKDYKKRIHDKKNCDFTPFDIEKNSVLSKKYVALFKQECASRKKINM